MISICLVDFIKLDQVLENASEGRNFLMFGKQRLQEESLTKKKQTNKPNINLHKKNLNFILLMGRFTDSPRKQCPICHHRYTVTRNSRDCCLKCKGCNVQPGRPKNKAIRNLLTASKDFSINDSPKAGRPKKKGTKPKKSEESLRTTVVSLQKELFREKFNSQQLVVENSELKESLSQIKEGHVVLEKVEKKKGKFYSFELAKSVIRLRTICGIPLRHLESVAKASLSCFFKDIDSIQMEKFPKKTTVARMQKCFAKMSKDFTENELSFIKCCALLFDGSTQFQNFETLAVSVNCNAVGVVKKYLLGMPNLINHCAAATVEEISSVIQRFSVNWEKVYWLIGDCTNGNTGHLGGVVAYAKDKIGQVIPFLKCNMHVLQYCFMGAVKEALGDSVLGQIETVSKKLNDGKFKNMKLIQELSNNFSMTITSKPCKTRICSYCKSCDVILMYENEIITMVENFINKNPKADNVEWKKCQYIMSNQYFLADVSFISDFYHNCFLPFLAYFENANTFEEKILVKKKIAEFRNRVLEVQQEIDHMLIDFLKSDETGSNNKLMQNCHDFIFRFRSTMTEDDLSSVGGWSAMLTEFEKRYFAELGYWNMFPFNCIDFFSDEEQVLKTISGKIEEELEHSDQSLERFIDLFVFEDSEKLLSDLKKTGSKELFRNSQLSQNLKEVFECMEFTNCFSERLFSIQHFYQRTKRNITREALEDYLFLIVNKTDLPNTPEMEKIYYDTMQKIRKQENEKCSNEVFDETFFEDYKAASEEYSEIIKKLMSKTW